MIDSALLKTTPVLSHNQNINTEDLVGSSVHRFLCFLQPFVTFAVPLLTLRSIHAQLLHIQAKRALLSVLDHKPDFQNCIRIQIRIAPNWIPSEYRTEIAVVQFISLPFAGSCCEPRFIRITRQPSVLYRSEPKAVGFSIPPHSNRYPFKIG